MKRRDARLLVEGLMREHGLDDWRVVFTSDLLFDRDEAGYGECDPHGKRILLHRGVVRANSPDAVRLLALHEIAHAEAPGGHCPDFDLTVSAIGGVAGTIEMEFLYSLSHRYTFWWWRRGRRLVEPAARRWDWVARAYGWWLGTVVRRFRQARRRWEER